MVLRVVFGDFENGLVNLMVFQGFQQNRWPFGDEVWPLCGGLSSSKLTLGCHRWCG